MGTGPTTTIRIDPQVKKAANAVFGEIGISMSTAVNAFLKAVVRENGMPFEMKVEPSKVKMKANTFTKNAALNHAYAMKKDEFYTQYEDIAKEMKCYGDAFKGKHILCNCDDPFESAFFRYFVEHFDELGLKKLSSTCYSNSSLSGSEYPLEGGSSAYKAEVTRIPEDFLERPDGSLDLESLFSVQGNTLQRLDGDGDFRSPECVSLLEKADIVITNPPFSLFREFIRLLEDHRKKFIILGNINASTCKEIFPLFRDDKVWYGDTIRSGDRKFYVPDDYPLRAANCGVDSNGRRFIRVKGVRWFTNIDNGRRHEALRLTHNFDPSLYPQYENYNAIDVSKTINIPADYDGYMGVPITFLDKYCPEQFEIVMLANGNARTNVDGDMLTCVGYVHHPEDRGGVGIVNGKRVYARVIIRRRNS
ncbi:type II toxin-antitoxin system RelB/DinJ family antitoxin [Bifidobacterium moukalabense]|uniref:type II toxin-antitoxin system RelB/DinJ family antitoxin n=1 Tax=Bifidobacterium moukalabense TaxID=1333651 RepID=UPI0010F7992F|nr:type II toxin-antitoxin system RelB/DinJ family antitoxin [Bifidobacterium moukalabense]